MLAGLVAGVLVLAPGAHAARPAPNVHTGSVYVPDEVIVRYAPSADRTVRASAQRSTGTGQPHVFAPRTRVLKIRDGESVAQTIAELERRPGVLSATPNLIAHASGFVPNDPGRPGGRPGGWQTVQWNFSRDFGVNAPDAWDRLNAGRAPGRPRRQGRGARHRRRLRDARAATAARPTCDNRFVKGFDFVDRDAYPDDLNGHGTHVASTIAETTDNGFGLDRPRLRDADHARARARPLGHRRQRRDQRGHPLRRPPRGEGHQPLASSSTRASRAARSPTSSTPCATPAARARS